MAVITNLWEALKPERLIGCEVQDTTTGEIVGKVMSLKPGIRHSSVDIEPYPGKTIGAGDTQSLVIITPDDNLADTCIVVDQATS